MGALRGVMSIKRNKPKKEDIIKLNVFFEEIKHKLETKTEVDGRHKPSKKK